VKYNLILRIEYHDKEGDKGSFSGVAHGLTKILDERKKHQINSYLKDIISNVNDLLYILVLLKLKQIRTKNKC
jgi:hypothetical protein